MQVSWDDGSILANTTVQSDSTFTVGFNIPSYAGLGGHNIYFTDLTARYFLPAVFTVVSPTPIRALPDIDVTYIERTPKYYRYCLQYINNIPTLCSGTENQKHWPNAGESVTYIAHVINKGDTSVPSGYSYQWLVNGTVVKSGTAATALSLNQETTFQYQTTFPSSPQAIQFKADTNNIITEFAKNNNALTIGSHDLTYKIWIEKGQYDIFNNTLNRVYTYSFEDWMQDHLAVMTQRFTQAVYPVTPQGILDRVRIDKVVIADELDGPTSPMVGDPEQNLIDGRWQFTDNDATNNSGKNGAWQQYVNKYAKTTDFGLIHELSHQLGAIDLYKMNLKNDPANNNGVHVKDASGNDIPASRLPTYAWGQILFQHPGIMGGGDTSPYNDTSYYESHTAAGLNSDKGYRRGYYGDYLFDTPTSTSLKITDNYGNPIPNAQVALYQKDPDTEGFDNTPEITGITDSQGVLSLPNRPVIGVTTVTGHTLKANPFGQIRVAGQNGTFLVKVTNNDLDSFGWFLLHDLNLAYWSGNKNSATIIIKTNGDNRPYDPANKALNMPASSNRQSNPGHEPAKAVDGDKTSFGNSWMVDTYPYTVNIGDWWQVDLGNPTSLGKIVIYPNAQNPGDWCNSFHADLSSTGAFSGEQIRIATETNSPDMQSLTYSFPTTTGRFIRITCDNAQNWVQLQEFEAYGFTTTPTVPAAPSGLGVGAVDGTSIRLSWKDNSNNEVGFDIFNGNTHVKVGANSTSYTWGGLTPGKYMCFQISSYNAAGSSAYTPWGCATTITPPAAPSGLTATPVNSSSIRLNWKDNSNNEVGFDIFNGNTHVKVGANSTSYTWGGLTPGKYMCFQISSYNVTGNSASTPYSCTTTPK